MIIQKKVKNLHHANTVSTDKFMNIKNHIPEKFPKIWFIYPLFNYFVMKLQENINYFSTTNRTPSEPSLFSGSFSKPNSMHLSITQLTIEALAAIL